MLIKQKSVTSQKFDSRDFWRINDSVLKKGKSATLPLLGDLRCCFLLLLKQNCKKKLSKNSNLDNSGIFLPTVPSGANLKLQNIHVTLKLVKKGITDLDLSKASGPNCTPVLVLKKCEPELSYTLAAMLICIWRNLVFQPAGRSHLWSLYLRMLRRSLWLKTIVLLIFFR